VNIASFEQKVPHVNPVDGKSMNRFYPGNPNGTQTATRELCIRLRGTPHFVERFSTRDGGFAPHAMFGQMSKAERMRHAYLHFDHHLRQFGT
jgi:hypothetical protein